MYEQLKITRIKCGEIFIMPNDVFAMVCKFCQDEFHTLEDFRYHLTEHFVDPPTDIKNEDSISLGDECELTLSEIHTEMNSTFTSTLPERSAGTDTVVADVPSSILGDTKVPIQINRTACSSMQERRNQPKRTCKLYQTINENEHTEPKYLFRSRTQLTVEHKRNRPPDGPIVYKCSFCSKISANKRQHCDHENTHTGNRPFKCRICFKGHCSSSALNRQGECRNGTCPKRKSSLSRQGKNGFHDERQDKKFKVNSQRSENHLPDTEPPINCQYCHRTFTLVGNKTRHEFMCSEKSSF